MNDKIKQNQIKLIYLTLFILEFQSSNGFALPFSINQPQINAKS